MHSLINQTHWSVGIAIIGCLEHCTLNEVGGDVPFVVREVPDAFNVYYLAHSCIDADIAGSRRR